MRTKSRTKSRTISLTKAVESKYIHTKVYGCCEPAAKSKSKSKSNCAKLNNLPKHVVLDGESLIKNNSHKICDCFIFIDDEPYQICLVELKSKNFKKTDIKEKFDKSITQLKLMLNALNFRKNYDITLALISKDPSRRDYGAAKSLIIRDRNKPKYINLMLLRCQLCDKIEKYARDGRCSKKLKRNMKR